MDQALVEEIINQAIEKAGEYYRTGQNDNAEALYRQILCVDPNHIIALQMLGILESRKKEHHAQALVHLNKALELEPDNPDVHNNMGLVLAWSDNTEQAEYHYRKAIELNPKSIVYRSNLGIFLKGRDRPQEAEAILKDAMLVEDHPAVWFNYATLMGELHRWEEAKEYYLKVLETDPENAPAHYNISNVYFYHGDYENGWKHYEYRWDTYPVFKKIYERFTRDNKPFWRGEDLKGKTIFLYAEQGIGDSIQFIRFCPMLKKMGATVIVEEHDHLVTLLKDTPGIDKIINLGKDAVPEFDYHQSLVSLPLYLKVYDLDSVPNAPYIKTNYEELPDTYILDESNWKHYDDYFRIGIVWAGNPIHRNDHIRSTQLKYFKNLQLPGVKLFSLQKDTRERFWPGRGIFDLAEGADGMGVVDLKDFMLDYNSSAALIDRMDLIISVDTATAHLAGAMGKPVWLIVAWHNDWRWMLDRSDTPWYPSMKIFRQPKVNDWDSVFESMRKELECLVNENPFLMID